MNGNKHHQVNFNPPAIPPAVDTTSQAGDTVERFWLMTLAGRAAGTYGVLFFIIALGMSMLGVDPLTRQGMMPKALLLFVGLATVIAAANIMMDRAQDSSFNWREFALNAWCTITRSDNT